MNYTPLICKNCGKEVYARNKERIYCRICARERTNKRGANSSIKRMTRNRNFIKDYKMKRSCEICGYKKNPKILEFHHKDPKDKNKGINILMKGLKNLDIIVNEIEKCVLLCPNCHAELHSQEVK